MMTLSALVHVNHHRMRVFPYSSDFNWCLDRLYNRTLSTSCNQAVEEDWCPGFYRFSTDQQLLLRSAVYHCTTHAPATITPWSISNKKTFPNFNFGPNTLRNPKTNQEFTEEVLLTHGSKSSI